MTSQTPIFNMSAVLRETGLNADVLRAWERRYNLPAPQRTPGGHRLYSQQDIETVKWLKARQAEGMSISRAVELWKETLAAGYALPHLAVSSPAHTPNSQVDVLGQRWLEACLAFDETAAEDALNQAFAMLPVETVCREILQRRLGEIGQAWYLGQTTVQQEHFASALVVRRIEALIAVTPPPYHEQSVLMGCPPGERHVLPALLLSLSLRRRGWRVIYLGADLPAEHLVETATGIRPDLVILTAQQLDTASALNSLALALEKTHIPLGFGGLIFNRIPAIRGRIPGHFLGETLEAGVRHAEGLLLSPVPSPSVTALDPAQAALARSFREKRALIEHDLFRFVREKRLSIDKIEEATDYFGASLAAALEFGSLEILAADLDWVTHRLGGPQTAQQILSRYLAAYDLAVRSRLGPEGAAISAWISTLVSNDNGALFSANRQG